MLCTIMADVKASYLETVWDYVTLDLHLLVQTLYIEKEEEKTSFSISIQISWTDFPFCLFLN